MKEPGAAARRDGRPRVIGGEEWCALPELGIPWVKSRVDSGARTSALHAWHIRRVSRDGEDFVSFRVHPLQRDRRTVVECEAPLVERRPVRSSSGATEDRYVIRTRLEFAGESFPIEVTLTSRDSMGYRMLLGREAMRERWVVDPSRSFLFPAPSRERLDSAYERYRAVTPHLVIGVLGEGGDEAVAAPLCAALSARGHRPRLIDVGDCELFFDDHHEFLHCGGQVKETRLDIVLSLLSRAHSQAACVLLRHFEYLGAHTPNSARVLHETNDRAITFQRLARSGCPAPRTWWTPGGVNATLDDRGAGARMMRFTAPAGGARVEFAPFPEGPPARSAGRGLLVQWLDGCPPVRAVRCYVAGTRMLAVPLDADGKGRLAAGKRIAPAIGRNAKRTVRRAMRALGLAIAAVDIIVDEDSVLVLDVDPYALGTIPRALAGRFADIVATHVERAAGVGRRPSD